MTLSIVTDSTDKVPVVKAKATHVIMNSLITKQTQESIQRFEQQAGLRDAGYAPHKGLTTEETKYLRVAEALHKLKLQSGEITEEEKQPAAQRPRGWFSSGSSVALPGPNPNTMDPGSGDKDRNSSDKWSLFGPRHLQKFCIQAYKGTQKPSHTELIRAQATRMAEDQQPSSHPRWINPLPRTHDLKPRDLNLLTSTGF
ncbi:hypothetical protein H1C71_023456 [Ictidomys tridecemlineatus]|uniref:Putative monooxygenase p33MONOX n=1 Tax=Ictidomys tridecemlineatus TaxID=43179 RepID=A0A287D355_ICTTR|nr:hypothetical protein H1C71_023456 [Ictidomys tridecemlineatus]